MGILRDTYIINKTDTSNISSKIIHNSIEKNPMTRKRNLYIGFELEEVDR